MSPMWVEWLMGWPIGWTDLRPLETVRFQQWRASHGVDFTELDCHNETPEAPMRHRLDGVVNRR
jgi:hypothetical protein